MSSSLPSPQSTTTTQQPITQYINLLSQTTNIQSIQSIIHKCLSDPKVHVGFNELSTIPTIQKTLSESTSTIGQSLLRTLDLFSYGLYLDYKKTKVEGKFVTLNDGQEMKLRMLTVVSIVQQVLEAGDDNFTAKDEHGAAPAASAEEKMETSNRLVNRNSQGRRKNSRRAVMSTTRPSNITAQNSKQVGIVQYSTLKKALDLSTNRQLEDILIQCIYSNLLPNGTKLDQKQKRVIIQHANSKSSSSHQEVHPYVLCRDVNVTDPHSSDLSTMISKLDSIYKKSENVKLSLNKALNDLNMGMREDVEKWKRVEGMIQCTKDKIAGDGNGGGGKQSFMMDIGDNNASAFDGAGGKRHLKRSRGGRPNNRMNFGKRG